MSKSCYHCKAENSDDAKFCKKCGRQFEQSCPKCGAISSSDAIYCSHCGTPLLPAKPEKDIPLWVYLIIVYILLVPLLVFSLRSCHSQADRPSSRDAEQITIPPADVTEGAESGCRDYDGNTYKTVRIGNQEWMAENLKTTHYSDGTPISQGSEESYDTPYWYYPAGKSRKKSSYGLLYNWKAVMRNSPSSETNPSNVQGICPDGWHVPSNAEWTQLTDYVSSQSAYTCSSNSSYIAKALASTTGWKNSDDECAVGNRPRSNNATGFGAMPAGDCYGGYGYFGSSAYFWSATEYGSSDAYYRSYAYRRYLGYGSAYVGRDGYYKDGGLSVRCLRDS